MGSSAMARRRAPPTLVRPPSTTADRWWDDTATLWATGHLAQQPRDVRSAREPIRIEGEPTEIKGGVNWTLSLGPLFWPGGPPNPPRHRGESEPLPANPVGV